MKSMGSPALDRPNSHSIASSHEWTMNIWYAQQENYAENIALARGLPRCTIVSSPRLTFRTSVRFMNKEYKGGQRKLGSPTPVAAAL